MGNKKSALNHKTLISNLEINQEQHFTKYIASLISIRVLFNREQHIAK